MIARIARLVFAFVAVGAILVALMVIIDFAKSSLAPNSNVVTDLEIGRAYRVADFETCKLPDGSSAYELHFGGADRSRRNQLTPVLDGRGRRIIRKVSDIPSGTMRLYKIIEHVEDPMLEGFTYGTHVNHWEGLVVDYNGPIRPQASVRPCGPDRR